MQMTLATDGISQAKRCTEKRLNFDSQHFRQKKVNRRVYLGMHPCVSLRLCNETPHTYTLSVTVNLFNSKAKLCLHSVSIHDILRPNQSGPPKNG